MAKIIYFLLAENCILDVGGRVSIVNIFHDIISSGDEAVPPKFTVVIGLTPEKDDLKNNRIEFEVHITGPNGQDLMKAKGGGEVPKAKKGSDVVSPLDLSGKLKFDQDGQHKVKLFINGKKKTELSFRVKLNQAIAT